MTDQQPSITRYLAHLTWRAIEQLPKEQGVVILPIGAIEQHGHHLPTLTDTLLVTTVLDRALAQLPATVAAWAMPALNYSKSNEHRDFPGTFALSASTLAATLHDLADGVKRAGFRRLVLLSGHGGNVGILDATARDIRAATGLMLFCLHPALLVDPPFAISAQERRYGFHAGELETSMVLNVRPELVQMEHAVQHFPNFPAETEPLFFFGTAATAWLSRDWSPTGVFGDATLGTAEKGEALFAAAATRLVKLITTISNFEIPT